MKEIFYDPAFWFSVVAIIAGFVMFVMINKSFATRREQLKNPIQSVDDDIRQIQSHYRWEKKEDMRNYAEVIPIIPIFMIVVGIICFIVTIIKYFIR